MSRSQRRRSHSSIRDRLAPHSVDLLCFPEMIFSGTSSPTAVHDRRYDPPSICSWPALRLRVLRRCGHRALSRAPEDRSHLFLLRRPRSPSWVLCRRWFSRTARVYPRYASWPSQYVHCPMRPSVRASISISIPIPISLVPILIPDFVPVHAPDRRQHRHVVDPDRRTPRSAP